MPGGKKFSHRDSIVNQPTCGGNIKAGLAPRATNFMLGVNKNHHFRGSPFVDDKTSLDYECNEQEPELEPEREPEQEPEQEPEREPEKEPEKEPEREPEKEPEQEPEQEPERTFVDFKLITNHTSDLTIILDGPNVVDLSGNKCGLYYDHEGSPDHDIKLHWETIRIASELPEGTLENVLCNEDDARGNNTPLDKVCDYYKTSRIIVKAVSGEEMQFNLGNKEGFRPTLAIFPKDAVTSDFLCEKEFGFEIDGNEYKILWSRCNEEGAIPHEEVDVNADSDVDQDVVPDPLNCP